MTRRFWGGVMVLAVLLTAGSASLMFDRLSQPEPQPVPLQPVPADEAPKVVEPSGSAPPATETIPPVEPAAPAVSAPSIAVLTTRLL